MAFGVYVHIPYCLQRCSYCDFATYVVGTTLAPQQYISILKEEIVLRQRYFPKQRLDTIYFGGGTPSLVEPELLGSVIEQLRALGFDRTSQTEITIEINPATLTEQKIEEYLAIGVNRFSVGAQTFDDSKLKAVQRQHSSRDTVETLALISKYKINFSFDLLFALPQQTLADLERDLNKVLEICPHHVSPYCLTVPESHPLTQFALSESLQVEMFELIHEKLTQYGYAQYEISNYARPGFESRHNMLYWNDDGYWGVGLSSHSYLPGPGLEAWGRRFWNPKNMQVYTEQIEKGLEPPEGQLEKLSKAQSLTDFCMISLRKSSGLELTKVLEKFGQDELDSVQSRLSLLQERQLIVQDQGRAVLSRAGILLSNRVFEELTFLNDEIAITEL